MDSYYHKPNYLFWRRGIFLLFFCDSLISISLAQDSKILRRLAPDVERAAKRTLYESIDDNFCDAVTNLDSNRCGTPAKQPKLDSGTAAQEVEPFSFPYFVGIYFYGYWLCSGTIISADLVVTSAHCVTHDKIRNLRNLRIITGIHKTRGSNRHLRSYAVKERVAHYLYDRSLSTSPFDIALLQTTKEITLSCYTRKVCLPKDMSPIQTGRCLAVGWGENMHGEQYPYFDSQHQQNMPIVGDDICRRYFPEVANNRRSYVCAGHEQMSRGRSAKHSACGLPLICDYNGVFYLQGVANSKGGFECASNGRIGLYTNVLNATNWIFKEGTRIGAKLPELFQQARSRGYTKQPVVGSSAETTECGVPDIKPTNVCIAGGAPVKPNSWPWQIALLLNFHGEWSVECGGSIIASRWILTAAHCVNQYPTERIKIIVGEHDISTESEVEKVMDVSLIFLHEKYNVSRLFHDIALLKLQDDIKFNKFVKPVCLPESEVPENTFVFTAGWGHSDNVGDNGISRVLKQFKVKVLARQQCRNRFPYIANDVICAGAIPEEEKGSCKGNSGGPLVSKHNGTAWNIQGVVSFGRECGRHNVPTVYTGVYYYIDWIKKHMAMYS